MSENNPKIDITLEFTDGSKDPDSPYIRLPAIPPIGSVIITQTGKGKIEGIEIDDSRPTQPAIITAYLSRV